MDGREHSLAFPLQSEWLANSGVDYLHSEASVKKEKIY